MPTTNETVSATPAYVVRGISQLFTFGGCSRTADQLKETFPVSFAEEQNRTRPAAPSKWRIFSGTMLAYGSGFLTQISMITILAPTLSAILAPANAAAVSMKGIGFTQISTIATPILGNMADRRRSFQAAATLTTWLNVIAIVMLIVIVESREAVGEWLSVAAFYAVCLLIGFSGNGSFELALGTVGVYSSAYPEYASSYTAVAVLCGLFVTVFAMVTVSMRPISDGHLEAVYIYAGILIANEVAKTCFLSKSFFQPYKLLWWFDPSSSTPVESGPSPNFVRDLLHDWKEAVRNWSSTEYRAVVHVVGAVVSFFFAQMVLSSLLLYFLEDQTSLGEDAQEFFTSTTAIVNLGAAIIAIPFGKCLDRLQRPLEVLAVLLFCSGAAFAGILLAASNVFWAIPGQAIFNLITLFSSVAVLPAFMAVTVNQQTIARDVTVMLTIGSVIPGIASLFISQVIGLFGRVQVPGRERLAYTLRGYEVVIGATAVMAILAGKVVMVAIDINKQRIEDEARKIPSPHVPFLPSVLPSLPSFLL